MPPDRKLLERVFLPNLASDPSVRRILFVGTANYCNYGNVFRGSEYVTIDPSQAGAQGGGQKHIMDRLANLGSYYPKEYFDLIILNGVLGWGLDDPDDIETSMWTCFTHLHSGGRLLIGLNETGGPKPVCLCSIDALKAFSPYNLPTMSVSRLDFDHPFDRDFTYAMYQRP